MASLDKFAIEIGRIAGDIEANANKVVRSVALAADSAVVTATPVDTGRARSNWQVEIDRPAEGVRAPYAEGSKLGVGERANLAGALAQASSKVAQFNRGGKGNNTEIHITNNVPYIKELNQGSSKQAPRNFVRIGVQAAVEAVRKSRLVRGSA